MRVLGVIPARKGSKSIPNKNVVPLCGKPLIEYTLAAAVGTTLAQTLVTTDCQEVMEIAEKWPVLTVSRPPELAKDDTPMISVLKHAVEEVSGDWSAICLLQPTCPMRRTEDINAAVELMEKEQATSVISYVDVGANHPARMAVIAPNGRPFAYGSDHSFDNKQDLQKVYLRSGDIYLVRTECLMQGDLVGDKPRAYIIQRERHVNVDGPLDLAWAEFSYVKGGCMSGGIIILRSEKALTADAQAKWIDKLKEELAQPQPIIYLPDGFDIEYREFGDVYPTIVPATTTGVLTT